jgi:hypothetical protein
MRCAIFNAGDDLSGLIYFINQHNLEKKSDEVLQLLHIQVHYTYKGLELKIYDVILCETLYDFTIYI